MPRPADLFGLITAGLPVPKSTTEEQEKSQATENIRQAGHQARSPLRAIVDRADGVNGQVGGGQRIAVLNIAHEVLKVCSGIQSPYSPV